nr:basic 7S globulin-like [Tanacetum cinerariifolium]
GYTSSTYKPAPCGSAPCRLLNTTSCTVSTTCDPPVPDCFNNTCGSGPDNPIANTGTSGQLGADVFTIQTGASLPAQLSSYFRFNRVFALCLSSSTRSSGAVFFGNGPYTLLPNVDASSGLTYTPLIVNPATENGFLGDASPKYFIEVKSIKINDKRVKLNETLLAFDLSASRLGFSSSLLGRSTTCANFNFTSTS